MDIRERFVRSSPFRLVNDGLEFGCVLTELLAVEVDGLSLVLGLDDGRLGVSRPQVGQTNEADLSRIFDGHFFHLHRAVDEVVEGHVEASLERFAD